MIKGPKAILSSAIANALEEYFVVDANTIESNLLKDAKIVLRHVKLKEQVARIPINSAGKTTKITVAGCVDEVAFTWAWSVGQEVWVSDAVLTIVGAKFQAVLEHEERNTDDDDTSAAISDERSLSESFVNPATIDAASANFKGGLGGFVERQVKMAFDMLTLKMIDFELRVVLPHPPQQIDVGVSSSSACSRVLAWRFNKIEILSFGRDGQKQTKDEAAEAPSKLKQRINLSSFVCDIGLEGEEGNELASYPLIEPFSYSADVIRLGERFGGFTTGLEVFGLGEPTDDCPDLASLAGSGLSVHMGSMQMESLMQLSVMLLAPPEDTTTDDTTTISEMMEETSESSTNLSGVNETSSFILPLSSASLVLFENHRFIVSGINMMYKADGTVCMLEAAKMEYESNADSSRAAASQIEITMRPAMKMTVGCIESLCIPDSVLLSKPIKSCEISYLGSTMIVRLDEVNIVTFSKTPEEAPPTNDATISAPNLPCNIDLRISNGIQMKKSEDGSLSKFDGIFHLYLLNKEGCTKVAIQFERFRNRLFSLNTVSFCGSLPLDQVDTVNDFIFTAAEAKVIAGHSTDEWSETFQPRKQKVKQSTKKVKQSTKKVKQPKSQAIRLPFANIMDMKVVIGLEGSHKISRLKEASLVIKPFKGKAETTSNDLISYYTKACLSRVPNFISNAEVLGLNIVDSTTGMWATWAAIPTVGSAFGAGAGVAAITAVDAVKGAVDAGKRNRNASEEESWKPGDFVRGLVQAAGEATRDGAALRGKEGKGNVIDWTVGATSNTAEYAVENKNRLGAAGAGGGGFLLGMALGGPIGAVVGGLVATATTGTALEALDKNLEKKGHKHIEDSKETSDIQK